MSEFVNFWKRDIELPPGCKDLIDVLRQPKFLHAPPFRHIEQSFPSSSCGRLEDITGYLVRLLKTKSPMAVLLILVERFALQVFFTSTGGPFEVLLVVDEEPASLQQEIRRFFMGRSINAIQDEPN